MTTIRFFGAAKEVTGSCCLIETGFEKILIDCGLFQGGHNTYLKNYEPLPFNAHEIDHVILTHAHADHSGRLPLLHKMGYKGSIHAHFATTELAEVILLDSAHIQEVEAAWRSKKNLRKGGQPVEPLYKRGDAESVLDHFVSHRYEESVILSDRIAITFHDAGHILGSAIVAIDVKGKTGHATRFVFTGDLGRQNQPIIRNPVTIDRADFLIIESTYGDRHHKDIAASKDELAAILAEAAITGGNVIIPSFAVGRSQELLYYFRELAKEGRVPEPYRVIHVDSPMAAAATKVYDKALGECYDEEAIRNISENGSAFKSPEVKFTSSVEESMALNMTPGGQLIVSASGMCDAGRILHHLRHNLWNENSHIVFVGYQAEGTKGRKIVDGQPVVKIMREEIAVKAHIHTVNALSAHADQEELLIWAAAIKTAPRLTMVVHGEPEQAAGLKNALKERFGFTCTIPDPGVEIFLE
jgi:metallo-beta-lactamase family protein